MDNQELTPAGSEVVIPATSGGESVMPEQPKPRKKQPYALKYLKQNFELYLMLIPGLLALLVFSYGPMTGLYLAFVEYTDPQVSFYDSYFVGWSQFKYVWAFGLGKYIKNTLILSGVKFIFAFPAPIILTLLINEVKNTVFKRVFQSVSYLPNFISWVMIAGMMTALLDSDTGLFNKIIEAFGGKPVSWYDDTGKWRPILIISSLWKGIGWGTITFLAVLTSIDPQLYEAATIDGAGKLKQTWHITMPGLSGIISITFILSIGSILGDDVEQFMALCADNPRTNEIKILGAFVYGTALDGNFTSYPIATAMGLVQGILSMILIITTNFIAKKMGKETIW